jgi:hypothetical protein
MLPCDAFSGGPHVRTENLDVFGDAAANVSVGLGV